MQLAVTTNIYYNRPDGRKRTYIESIEKIAGAGFDCVDFQFHNAVLDRNNELCADDWERNVDDMVRALDRCGVRANQAHSPFYEFLDPDLKDREWKDEMTRRSVIAAGKLGVRWIVFHPGTLFGDPRRKENFRVNVEHFKPLLELAGQYGMGIALENIFDKFMFQPASKVSTETPQSSRMTTGFLRTARYFANWPEELAELVDALRPWGLVGACWDTGHGHEMMVDQALSIEILGSRLKALHVNDNFGVQDNHLLPYFGHIRWDGILAALKKVGYDGELTFEVGMNFSRVPEELIDDAFRYAAKVGRHMIGQYDKA